MTAENISSVFHGSVAKTSRETEAVPAGLIPEFSGEVGNKRERGEMSSRRSPCGKASSEGGPCPLQKLLSGPGN